MNFKASSLKIKTYIIVSVLKRVKKMPKNGVKNYKKYFFVINKYQDVTNLYPTLCKKKLFLQKKIFKSHIILRVPTARFPKKCHPILFSSLASYSLQINMKEDFYYIDVTKIFVLRNFLLQYLLKINHNIFLAYMLYNTYTNYTVFITKNDVFYGY